MAETNCQVNSCCFIVELRVGSLILAALHLVWNIILAILLIWSITVASSLIGPADAIRIITILLGVDLGIVILNMIFLVVLLFGLLTYKRGALKVYLTYGCVYALIILMLFILNIVFGSGALSIIFNLIDLFFTIYTLVVIRSYYLKMDDGQTTQTSPARYS